MCVSQKEAYIYTPKYTYHVSEKSWGHKVWHWSTRQATAMPKATRNLYFKGTQWAWSFKLFIWQDFCS